MHIADLLSILCAGNSGKMDYFDVYEMYESVEMKAVNALENIAESKEF